MFHEQRFANDEGGRGRHHHGRCFQRGEEQSGPRAWFFGGWEGGPEGRGRHGFGHGFGGRRGRWERGFNGGRLFDAGDLKLVILKLLSEEPSYGYQLMKRMEERLAGGYTPSAGVIYPTLTLLEEEGLASVSTSNDNKKVYTVTQAGLDYLHANKQRIEELFARLDEASEGFERGRSPELMKAFMNLRAAVVARVWRRSVSAEQIKKIAEAIDAAAKAIDEL
jgi:DNA-binding PadR family transcriptional regulator